MLQFFGFEIKQYKALQQTVVKDKINTKMVFLESKAFLSGNESKACPKLQQELLQMVDQSAFQLCFRKIGLLRNAQKFENIGIFHKIGWLFCKPSFF